MTPIPLHVPDCQHHHGPVASGSTAELRHEHEVILRALAIAERLGRGLQRGEAVDRAALAWVVDFFRTFADGCHHAKEEQHLFPVLERHGVPRDGGPIGTMLDEHEQGRALLREMASGDDRRVAEAIGRYAALLRAHIDKENEVLFRLAEQLLSDAEQSALVAAFEDVERAVVGPGIHERLLAELGRFEAPGAAAAV